MNVMTFDRYGALTEPATLTIRRVLPGPVERVWAFLTDSDLRRQWLAAGDMRLEVGAPFELVWDNDHLTGNPGTRPDGIPAEHRMESRITELDPPRRIAFTWSRSGDVSIELRPQGEEVLLTLVHRRLADRTQMLGVSAGWHKHLDLLEARARGTVQEEPFWDAWSRLRAEYEARLQA